MPPLRWASWPPGPTSWPRPTSRPGTGIGASDSLTIVRADRFSEGTIAEAVESGLLAAIAARARVLAA
jgi:hypothetical protein